MNILNNIPRYSQIQMDAKQAEVNKYKKLYRQLKNKEDSLIQREKNIKIDREAIQASRTQALSEIQIKREELKDKLKEIQGMDDRERLLNQKEQKIKELAASQEQFKLECMETVYEAKKSSENCSHALKKLRFKYSELKKRSLVFDHPTT